MRPLLYICVSAYNSQSCGRIWVTFFGSVDHGSGKGVGTNFGVGQERRGPKGRERDRGSWGGATSPSPPARGLRERCKLPQPRPPKGFLVFCGVRLPFPASQYTCCIQFARLGIRFFSGYIHINIPHINSWGVRSPAYPRFRRPWVWDREEPFDVELANLTR